VRVNKATMRAGIVALLLIAAAAAFLGTQHARQRLGQPGVRLVDEPIFTQAEAGSTNLVVLSSNRVFLPPRVLDYESRAGVVPHVTVQTLPKDTSYGMRFYANTNGHYIDCQVVLMGTDRTSIHKPQYCLRGSGLEIVASAAATVRVAKPHPYDLPIMKLKLRGEGRDPEGNPRSVGGVFVYWFVAEDALTASHMDRVMRMSRHMLTTGELQRWAYVMCYTLCEPGEEEAAFERLREFIAASVPEFQIPAGAPLASTHASH
jgi:hypothetical protein